MAEHKEWHFINVCQRSPGMANFRKPITASKWSEHSKVRSLSKRYILKEITNFSSGCWNLGRYPIENEIYSRKKLENINNENWKHVAPNICYRI